MLPIYTLTIAFKPSNDYRKLVLLIYGLALIALLHSTCSAWIGVPIGLLLVMHVYPLLRCGLPMKGYHQLIYQGERWFLQTSMGATRSYTQVLVRMDMGLLMWIDLLDEETCHRMVLFHDQLSTEQRRQLYLLQLMQARLVSDRC